MPKEFSPEITQLFDALRKEPDFRPLAAEYKLARSILLMELEHMPPSQSDAVHYYLGVLLELHTRMLDLALRSIVVYAPIENISLRGAKRRGNLLLERRTKYQRRRLPRHSGEWLAMTGNLVTGCILS